MSNDMKQAFDALMTRCAENKLPLTLRFFDGPRDVWVSGDAKHKRVLVVDALPESDDEPLAGHVVIEFDAATLMRLLPALMLEAQRALGMVPPGTHPVPLRDKVTP